MLNRFQFSVRGFIFVLFIISLLTPAFLACARLEAGGPRLDQSAPSFELKDTNGRVHSLADYKGKYVVLEWLNHDCPFVRKHYNSGNMQKLQKEFVARGIVWFSVNSSAPGKQGHFKPARANELTRIKGAGPSAILLDGDGKIGRAYGARTTPHMYIIDPAGILRYKGAIDSVRSTDVADVAGAQNYVRNALQELLAGKPVTNKSTSPYGCSVKY